MCVRVRLCVCVYVRAVYVLMCVCLSYTHTCARNENTEVGSHPGLVNDVGRCGGPGLPLTRREGQADSCQRTHFQDSGATRPRTEKWLTAFQPVLAIQGQPPR